MKIAKTALLATLALVLAAAPTLAQIRPTEDDLPTQQKIYSPYVERTVADKNFAEGVYWGDTHLHTRYSTDAGMIGRSRRSGSIPSSSA
jgi:hypothetical protein